MASEYPKRLVEVYKTSDGQFFETAAEANVHENKSRIESALRTAIYAAASNGGTGEIPAGYRYGNETGRRAPVSSSNPNFVAALAYELMKAGLSFN